MDKLQALLSVTGEHGNKKIITYVLFFFFLFNGNIPIDSGFIFDAVLWTFTGGVTGEGNNFVLVMNLATTGCAIAGIESGGTLFSKLGNVIGTDWRKFWS